MSNTSLTITRKKEHVYDTAYAGVRVRPGISIITDEIAIARLLTDKRFQQDRENSLFTVTGVGIPDMETLEANKGPSVVDLLAPEGAKTLGEFPSIIPSTASDEAKAIAGQKEKAAVEFVGGNVDPHVLFALYKADTRAKVRTAISEQLKKIYGRDLTEAEILAVGTAA